MATPDILKLPPELVLRVSSLLTTTDLCAFRASCKQIEAGLFDSFAKEFFSKRQFMIEQVSLEVLVGIANHKTIAPYLKEVIICLDYLGPSHGFNGRQKIKGHVKRGALIATGQARDMLVDAFSNLPNLRTVGLRDYNAAGRLRDGENVLWRSYGWSTGMSVNARLNVLREGRHRRIETETPDEALPLILFALGQAECRPTNLEVFLRRQRLPDDAFNVFTAQMQPKIEPLLPVLKTLLLSLNDRPGFGAGPTPTNPHADSHEHLKQFLRRTPLLEHLRLNFLSDESDADDIISWLGEPNYPSAPTPTPGSTQFSHLTTLDLGMLNVQPQTLLHTVKQLRLTSLSLWKVSLRDNTSPNTGDRGVSTWKDFLQELGDNIPRPLDFTYFKIGFPSHVQGPNNGTLTDIRFAGNTTTDQNGVTKYEDLQSQVSYRKYFGSDVRTWLRDLKQGTYVEPVEPHSDSDHIDDDEDNSDNESGIEEILLEDDEDNDGE